MTAQVLETLTDEERKRLASWGTGHELHHKALRCIDQRNARIAELEAQSL
jgi:hypothetical protein